jgi:acetylornithine deacetylase/succinyl-diaminopimelate desuccinylase-like protein
VLAETPRENGTAGLHRAADFLHQALGAAGVEATLVPFTASPYALRLAGVIALTGGLLYFRLLRGGRYWAALATALAIPALMLAQLDFQVPVFGWLGAQTQYHVVGRVPAAEPEQRLVFAAHYDTKTDLLDHLERAPAELLAVLVVPLMLAGALAGAGSRRSGRRQALLRRTTSVAAWAGLGYGAALFTTLSAGAFVPARSPGALDDGASCALLVKLAERLAAQPLQRTEVEVLLLSAEEVGVQGSWVYASDRFAEPPELPTAVVNLEALGASVDHGVLPTERFTLRAYPADPSLLALLDGTHQERFGKALEVLPIGGATDARSFLAHGIPAATLYTAEEGSLFSRGLHSASDSRDRIDESALAASLAYLLDVAQAADAHGLRALRSAP